MRELIKITHALRANQGTSIVPASFTPTSKVSWKVEAFSLCMFLLLLTLREVPHGTKGTGPRFVTRLMHSRSQLQEQHKHSFCSKSTNAFISYSLYMVRRYCTSPGTPDLRARLGRLQGSTRNGMQRGRACSTGGPSQ